MTYNGYTNWDTWNAFNRASSEYWSYRWIMGLSVEELADYITDHAEAWAAWTPGRSTCAKFTRHCTTRGRPQNVKRLRLGVMRQT